MTAFSNLPAQAVLPLDAYRLDELRRAARGADQRWFEVDLADCRDKDDVLSRLALGLSLPAHFGKNLDALYDSVTDLVPIDGASKPGFVFVLRNIPQSQVFDARQRDALLDVFRDAADHFHDRGTAFRVFYSVAGRR